MPQECAILSPHHIQKYFCLGFPSSQKKKKAIQCFIFNKWPIYYEII